MWIREGYCCGCGQCCVGSPPGFGPPVEGYCPAFRPKGDGTGICAIHGSDDPYWNKACKGWPYHPDNIKDKPRCTFTFVWRDD